MIRKIIEFEVVALLCCLNVLGQDSFSHRLVPGQEGPSDSALIRAVVHRDTARVRELLRSGASPNAKDRFGTTPLGAAIVVHEPDFAELLVRKGANVNLVADDKGTSPLMLAAWYCDIKTGDLLLKRGAEVNHRNDDGENAIGSAADACRNADMIKLLLVNGADINAKTKLGRTPLIEAASSGNEDAVRELVQAGANVKDIDDKGNTAESSACGRVIGRSQGHDQVCSFLRAINRG